MLHSRRCGGNAPSSRAAHSSRRRSGALILLKMAYCERVVVFLFGLTWSGASRWRSFAVACWYGRRCCSGHNTCLTHRPRVLNATVGALRPFHLLICASASLCCDERKKSVGGEKVQGHDVRESRAGPSGSRLPGLPETTIVLKETNNFRQHFNHHTTSIVSFTARHHQERDSVSQTTHKPLAATSAGLCLPG